MTVYATALLFAGVWVMVLAWIVVEMINVYGEWSQ